MHHMATPLCSNCGIQPVTDAWQCFPDWCSHCDASLWLTRSGSDDAACLSTPTITSDIPRTPKRKRNSPHFDHIMAIQNGESPFVFVSITCNPYWKEIRDQVPAGTHWTECHDVVTQVFLSKFDALIDTIVGQKFFGEVQAHVHQIELSPRALPRADMLIILDAQPLTRRRIDSIVCAEVPCPTTQPVLYRIVSTFMVHPPCDVSDSADGARCRKFTVDNTCSQRFPKISQDRTTFIQDSDPHYKRRCRFSVKLRDREISDIWVIPYNPVLLLKFDCHLNVQVSANIKSFKRVLKYVCAIRDRAVRNSIAYCSGACSQCCCKV